MGLDMFLYKKTYVKNWSFEPKENKKRVYVSQGGKSIKHIKPKRVAYITEEVMYWRKSNHIHQWFVQNIQNGVDDCGNYELSIDQLKELRDECKIIVDDKSKAPTTLPTTPGFFFGSTDYDKYYHEDTKRTLKELNKLIEEYESIPEGYNKPYYEYHSSW